MRRSGAGRVAWSGFAGLVRDHDDLVRAPVAAEDARPAGEGALEVMIRRIVVLAAAHRDELATVKVGELDVRIEHRLPPWLTTDRLDERRSEDG
jgi:hypothetical protein